MSVNKDIIVKSFNGIGDLLFATPSFRVIKQAYPNRKLIVNTNRPSLLENNPFIDVIGTKNEGVFLNYPAPDGGKLPTQHHILTDWQIICNAYDLKTEKPKLKPELYLKLSKEKKDVIGVQTEYKDSYYSKRIWPYCKELAKQPGFEAITHINKNDVMQGLVYELSKYKAVVCGEGGISHIAAAINLSAVVLFGGFSDPIWTGYPYHINVTSDVDCKHCFNLNPCKKGFVCWQDISVQFVQETALKLVNEYI